MLISKDIFFAQPRNHAHDFVGGQSQNIADVIHARFGFFVGCAQAAALRKQLFDDAHSGGFVIRRNQRRLLNFRDGFFGVFAHDAAGIHARHILPTLDVARFFQRCDGGFNACFQFIFAGFFIVPASGTRDVQRRFDDVFMLAHHLFERFPYLLDFVFMNAALVEHDEMLVQIAGMIERKTFRLYARVASCPPCFLDVVFQRIRNLVMHHQTHVFFVHAHAEGGSRHHNLRFTADKAILMGNFFF